MTDFTWFVLDVNPEPWAIGDLSVGRKGKSVFPKVGRNQQLWNYQQAIKEAIGKPDVWFDGNIELMFFFWRSRDEYQTHQARTHRKHEADLTNLQKATEDALQDILFKNDKDVRVIHSVMMDQGADVHGKVVIGIREASTFHMFGTLPAATMQLVEELDTIAIDNEWRG